MTAPLVLSLPSDVAGHAAVALRRHRQQLARDHVPLPEGYAELERAFTSSAIAGQRGTAFADLWDFAESQNMPARLMTYQAAADYLGVSLRSFKRLLADPNEALNPVPVGGSQRVDRRALDAYIDNAIAQAERKAG